MRRGTFEDLPSVSRIAAIFFGLAFSLACTDGRNPDHVVIISIDGFRPEFYQDATWPAPMIQQMAQEGVQVNAVRGVFPSVTYPSHTTMITGAVPRRHGIYYNTPFEPEGQTGRWYWHASAIRVPTLWDAVRKAGLKSASISWPASVGGPIDWNIPEFWSLEPEGSALDAIRSVTRPPELFAEVMREATGPFTDADFEDRLLRDDRIGVAAAYLLEQHRPALSAVPGTSFSASFRPPAVREAEGGNHGHFPDLPQVHTGFVGWGVGFRSGAVLSSMGIEDTAPLIAELLGIPFEAPDGVSPKSLMAVQD